MKIEENKSFREWN